MSREFRPSVPLLATVLLLAGFASTSSDRAEGPDRELMGLVLAERAFCRASVERGMREAFLEFLAEESVIFRPGPVNGKAWFRDRPAGKGVLSWEPLFADLSRSGDLGYTTGPWQFTPGVEHPRPRFGHYVTIWKRESAGPWKVAADIGISHPRPESSARDLSFPARASTPANRVVDHGEGPSALERLVEADRSYATLAETEGAGAACLAHAATGVRVYRDEALPVTGMKAACAFLAERGERFATSTTAHGISRAGDLGYTYGNLAYPPTGGGSPGGAGSYLRIWKTDREGGWRLELELSLPHPRPSQSG